jgi:hypothetical protein
MNGLSGGGQFGVSVSSAKDVNGDGIDDMIIGSSSWKGTALISRAYVVFGGDDPDWFPQFYSLSNLDGFSGFRMDVEDAGDVDGERYNQRISIPQSDSDSNRPSYYTPTVSVGTIGSINGDRYNDVALGVPGADCLNGNASTFPFPLFLTYSAYCLLHFALVSFGRCGKGVRTLWEGAV